MKVCIIGQADKQYLPYVNRYTEFFKRHNIPYDIIYWQQEEHAPLSESNEFYFTKPLKGDFFEKWSGYLQYRKYVLSILEKGNYDRIISLTTLPCFLLRKYLLENYKNRYLLDIRDYTFEKYKYYRDWVHRLVANSFITTISSKGFLDFLPKSDKIIMNHNVHFWEEEKNAAINLKERQVINLCFLGKVRYFDENCLLLDQMKNTFRYQLWYIGKPVPDCDIPEYCKQHNINNVSFIEKYTDEQKPILYENIDIINSIYDKDDIKAAMALPHRLYEACIFKKPILSSKQTYLGELIAEYGLGLVVDIEKDDVLSLLNEYVNTFNPAQFTKNCNRFLNEVRADETILYQKLESFIQ